MGVKKFVGEVIKEGRRVRWPKRDQFIPTFVAAIVICGFCALVLSLEDLAAGSLIGQLRTLFSSFLKRPGAASEVAESIRAFFGFLN
jgi:preprotein translocase SecE subunit